MEHPTEPIQEDEPKLNLAEIMKSNSGIREFLKNAFKVGGVAAAVFLMESCASGGKVKVANYGPEGKLTDSTVVETSGRYAAPPAPYELMGIIDTQANAEKTKAEANLVNAGAEKLEGWQLVAGLDAVYGNGLGGYRLYGMRGFNVDYQFEDTRSLFRYLRGSHDSYRINGYWRLPGDDFEIRTAPPFADPGRSESDFLHRLKTTAR